MIVAAHLNGASSVSVGYYTTKNFGKSLQKAFLGGGRSQKIAMRVRAILGSLGESDPFVSVSVTNHGESRIENAVKYDLGDGWRLVTQQTEKTCFFLYIGSHEDVDHWLDGHKGLKAAVRDSRAVLLPGAGHEVMHSNHFRADHHDTPLVDRLEPDAMDHLLNDIPRSLARRLEALDARSTTKELEAIVAGVSEEKAGLIYSVFNLLLSGDYEGAQGHLDYSMGRISGLDDVGDGEILEIKDGEDIRRLRLGSSEYEEWLLSFEKRSTWQDWFLYLHPEQETVVLNNYPGTSQLSGVSGAGKTCVAVRRALRLAQDPGSRILLLTLNRSLAGLLKQLIEAACTSREVGERIPVTSFFELAQELLHEFEPENDRLYCDVTWKHDEHVDLVFREYYRQWLNNPAARVLLPLHKSLTARGVSGENYIREEFDWVRSALRPDMRKSYLNIERRGRKFPLPV